MHTVTQTTLIQSTHRPVDTMRAAVQDRYGSAAALEVRAVEVPEIGDTDVLVRVVSAGVDRGVWHLMTGLPYPTRLGFGLRRPRNPIPGMDVAGVVEATGPGVTRFAAGDAVFGVGHGTYAEFARASEDKLASVPRGISLADAGGLAVTGSTALQAVEDHGRVQPGQRVLVLGASGGVGTFAVQIARAAGARVTGVASGAKLDLVEHLGADEVVDYRTSDPLDGTSRYDVIIDTGGNRRLRDLRHALTPTGTLVIVGGEGGGRWLGGLDRQLRAVVTSFFVRQRLTTFVAKEDDAHLERLADLVETGQVTPVVDRHFPLVEVRAAMEYLEAGRARGKVVLDVDGRATPSRA
jgi:NADPH:quinone reductase-like Zn-dependent oxidoreductase